MNGPAQILGGGPAVASGGARCGFPRATGETKMPDGSMTNLNARNSAHSSRRTIAGVSTSTLHQIWREASKLDVELFSINIALDIVFSILDELSSELLRQQEEDPDEGWKCDYPLSYTDQLYYLLGDIAGRCKALREAENKISGVSRTTSFDVEPVEKLAQARISAEKAFDTHSELDEDEERKLEEAYLRACDRLVAFRTTTPLGILRKLEYVAKVESLDGALKANPRLAVARVILGLISDLKEDLGV